MKTIRLFFVGALLMLLGTTGCIDDFVVEGNGLKSTEIRNVPEFDKVKSSGSFDVYITNGIDHEVVVSADENLQQFIETWVSDGTLHIDVRGVHSLRAVVPIEVFVTTTGLSSIVQSGSGMIRSDFFEARQFDMVLSGSGSITASTDATLVNAVISGSGRITVAGVATDADLNISGSGKIDASDLTVERCHTRTSGSGDMWISVADFLESHISGSGNVYYYGSPDVEKHISGSGKVYDKD